MEITKELIKALLQRYSNIGRNTTTLGHNWLENVENYEDKVRLVVLWEQIACIMLQHSYTGTFESIVFELAKYHSLKTKEVLNAKSFVEVLYSRHLNLAENDKEYLKNPLINLTEGVDLFHKYCAKDTALKSQLENHFNQNKTNRKY